MLTLTCTTCGATCQTVDEGLILASYFWHNDEAADRTGTWSLIKYDNGWFGWCGLSKDAFCPQCGRTATLDLNHLF